MDERILPSFLEVVSKVGNELEMIVFSYFRKGVPLTRDLFENKNGFYIRFAYTNLAGNS